MRFIALGAAIVGAVAAYSAWWLSVAHSVPALIAQQAERARAAGYEVETGTPTVEGYPYRMVARLPRLVLAAPKAAGSPRYEGEQVTMVAQPWNLNHLIIRADGTERLSWQPAGDAGRTSLKIDASRAFASLVLRDGALERLALDLTEPRLRTDAMTTDLGLKRIQVHARRLLKEEGAEGAGLELALEAEAAALPPEWSGPLGPEMALARLALKLSGPLPVALDAAAAAAWRDAGGTLEVEQLAVKWGRMDATGDGTLALDEQMRPLGAFGLHVSGWEQGIAAAVASGRIKQKAGDAARLALGLLGLANHDAEGRVGVPFTLQNGRVLVGPVPVATLDPLF